MTNTHERFAAWLHWQLQEGETRVSIAKRLGCHASHVTKIALGDRNPGLKVAAAIERESGIPAAAWIREAA